VKRRLDRPDGIGVAGLTRCLVVGVAAISLASCSGSSSHGPSKTGDAVPTTPKLAAAGDASDPLLRLIATMPVRTGQGFREPATGEMLKVEVVRAYDAASGRNCREYVVTDTNGVLRQGVACRDGDKWVAARPLRLDETPLGAARPR